MKTVLFFALIPAAFAFPPRSDPFSALGPWSKRTPSCVVPRFVERLPEEAAAKVHAIWANYKEGESCETEHKETRRVIQSLPEETREEVFAGRCGPSFLRNVSKTVREEFRSVWFDHRLSLDLKEVALKKLAYSLLTGPSLALFNKWEEELQTRKTELATKVDALSPAAKEAFENWKAIRVQERAFLGSLPKTIREELKTLCPWHIKEDGSVTSTTPAATTTTSSTTTAAPETTTLTEESTTTVAPLVEEEKSEKEFAVFLDVQMPQDFNADSECAAYA